MNEHWAGDRAAADADKCRYSSSGMVATLLGEVAAIFAEEPLFHMVSGHTA